MEAVKKAALLALCAVLSGCSAMQGIGAAASAIGGDAPSVDATAQVGKENKQEGDSVLDNRETSSDETKASTDAEVSVSDNTGESTVVSKNVSSNDTEKTSTDSGVSSKNWEAESILVQTVPTFVLILLALGWFLPSPAKVLKGIGNSILFIKEKVFRIGVDK